jgi:Protein of unknown function (DUF3995)
MRIAGVVAAAIFFALALLHAWWALGGRSADAVIPQRGGTALFRPGRIATWAVAVALACAGAIVLGRMGWWSLPVGMLPFTGGCWTLATVLAARAVGDFRYVGFFKREHASRFARYDSRLYSPLCLALAVICAGVALEG